MANVFSVYFEKVEKPWSEKKMHLRIFKNGSWRRLFLFG
jgi:hypothetical protein